MGSEKQHGSSGGALFPMRVRQQREEIAEFLRRMGCERVGSIDAFGHKPVLLGFERQLPPNG